MGLLEWPILIWVDLVKGKPTDQSYGLLEKTQIAADVANGNWASMESKIEKLSGDDLTKVIDGLTQIDKDYSKILDYVNAHDSEVQRVIAGALYTQIAWLVRSGKRAVDITDDQALGFLNYLDKAELFLINEFKNPALQIEGLARRVRVYLGMGEEFQALEAFKECTALAPNQTLAHIAYLIVVTPKWMGNREEMMDFANSPKDPQVRTLTRLMAAVEIYSDYHFDDMESAKVVFQSREQELCKKVLGNLQIAEDDSLLAIHTRNYLACLYNALGYTKKRNEVINQLKGQVTSRPWVYFGVQSERDLFLYKLGGML